MVKAEMATTREQGKFGARMYLMDTDVVYVLQTVKRGSQQNSPYVVDKNPNGEGQRFVDTADDKAIADAVREALHGTL